VRLPFRSEGQAEVYWKICRRILEESCHGHEGAQLGRERIRNAVYRGFGYNHFSDFQRSFAPNNQIKVWFHSEEQLKSAFSHSINEAIEVARERGFECEASIEDLVKRAVSAAMETNDASLLRIINSQR
jgi:hypothetical protein